MGGTDFISEEDLIPEEDLDFLPKFFKKALPNEYLAIWTLPSKTSWHYRASELIKPASDDAGYILEASDQLKEDLYFGVGLLDKVPEQGRGTQKDVCAIPAFWLDIDLAPPLEVNNPIRAHASSELPTLEKACAFLDKHLPPPTFVIDSGWGLHVYWQLEEMCRNVGKCKRQIEAFQVACIEKARLDGWHLDKTSDLSRVLRVPGTINYKIKDCPKPVTVLFSDKLAQYKIEDLVSPSSPVETVLPINPPSAGEDPAISKDVRENLKKVRRPEMSALLKGESYAKPGERDLKTAGLCQSIANLYPNEDIDSLAGLFVVSLMEMTREANDPENPAITIEDVKRKLRSAQAKKIEELKTDQKLKDAISSSILPSVEDQYTEEQVKAFAVAQNCTVEEFQRRWIIQRGSSFYVFVNGNYERPIGENELAVSLPRDLAKAPIEWTKIGTNGHPRKKRPSELLDDYATVCKNTIADLSLKQSYYDPDSKTFFEAVCPVRDIKPQRHEQIEQWLKLLGGKDSDILLDWIATITLLNRQTCSLYLSGSKGAGKGLLATGLARLWTQGGPSSLKSVLSSFNSVLVNCPLIFCDEMIPPSFQGKRGSAELRELIGSQHHTLRRKFIPDADLRGAVRLLLAANNENMLALGDEDLTSEDLIATGSRFLHIRTPKAAVEYLKTLGGINKGTTDWVDGDRIAAHALWLKETRKVIHGERFIVEGHVADVHNRLSSNGVTAELVKEWLARLLDNPKPEIMNAKPQGVKFDNGRLLVNSKAIVDFWGSYIVFNKSSVPQTSKIGRVLRNLSLNSYRTKTLRYHNINLGPIFIFAKDNLIGNVNEMKKRLNGISLVDPELIPETEDFNDETTMGVA